jgi:hypothetical protein
MRTLSSTLLAAQQAVSHTPCVKVELKNKMTGVTRLIWERLYQGTETEYFHGLTLAEDGSLIRVRIAPGTEGNKLYRQRVINPGTGSDFGTWTYTGQYNCMAVAAVSSGSDVSIIWINSNREINRLRSTNYGASWNSPELLDSSVSANIRGLAAAYKPNGDLALFFADQSTIWVKKYTGGVWRTKTAWDKTTGALSSVAAAFGNDWNLLLTGQSTDGGYKVWSLIYGDGVDVPAGTWSALKELASAPFGGDYEYAAVSAGKPDVMRAIFVEKYKGIQSYSRPFWTYAVPVTGYAERFWREPSPFNLSCQYGMAIAHSGGYCWLSAANGVWRSILEEDRLDVTGDVISVQHETLPASGQLTIELRNDTAQYLNAGDGDLSALKIGSQLEFSPGYVTPQGNETSAGIVCWLEEWENISSAGKSSLILYGVDGWHLLENWRARHQFRWNKDTGEMPVKQMLAFILARVGLQLEVKSQSAAVTGFYPDFTIHPGDSGGSIIRRLLSFVPDVLFIEGIKAYLVNPQTTDIAINSYGQTHSILQGKYRSGSWQINQVRVEGSNASTGAPVISDSFSWEQMAICNDRVRLIADRNITTVVAGQALAGAFLRKAEIESIRGSIQIPVNCGQQLFDVIELTDSRCGLQNIRRRVMGISLSYRPGRGEYEQTIILGGV